MATTAPTLTLHYAPQTRANRPRWLLEELGVAYELHTIDLRAGEGKTPAHLARHPHGAVPALTITDGGGSRTMLESAAMCLWIADRFGLGTLAPALEAPARATYLQWMVYGPVTLEPAIITAAKAANVKDGPADPEAAAEARAGFQTPAEVISRALESGPWLLGETFTAADVIIGSMLVWARFLKLLDGWPVLEAYCKRVAERPAFKRARS